VSFLDTAWSRFNALVAQPVNGIDLSVAQLKTKFGFQDSQPTPNSIVFIVTKLFSRDECMPGMVIGAFLDLGINVGTSLGNRHLQSVKPSSLTT